MSIRETIQKRIRQLDARIAEIISGVQSASISSGGASQSYTNHSLSELRKEREYLKRELKKLNGTYRAGGIRRHAPDFD